MQRDLLNYAFDTMLNTNQLQKAKLIGEGSYSISVRYMSTKTNATCN